MPSDSFSMIGRMKTNSLLGVIFFDIKLLLQPDVVFDFESNGRNLSSPAPPGSEKKNLFHLSQKMRKNAHAY